MELYYIIAVTDADRGEVMNALFREAGLPMILSMPGRGTAKNEHLAVYGLGETPKTVTCAVAGAQQAAQLTRAAKRRLFIDIPGNGILLTVPLKSVAGDEASGFSFSSSPRCTWPPKSSVVLHVPAACRPGFASQSRSKMVSVSSKPSAGSQRPFSPRSMRPFRRLTR